MHPKEENLLKIGIVSQFSQMLNLSIRENLLLADRHAGEEEIRNSKAVDAKSGYHYF